MGNETPTHDEQRILESWKVLQLERIELAIKSTEIAIHINSGSTDLGEKLFNLENRDLEIEKELKYIKLLLNNERN